MNQVKKLEKAAKVFQQEASDAGLAIPDVTLWVICTGVYAGSS